MLISVNFFPLSAPAFQPIHISNSLKTKRDKFLLGNPVPVFEKTGKISMLINGMNYATDSQGLYVTINYLHK